MLELQVFFIWIGSKGITYIWLIVLMNVTIQYHYIRRFFGRSLLVQNIESSLCGRSLWADTWSRDKFIVYPVRDTQLVTEILRPTSWILLSVSRLKSTSIRFHRQCFPLVLENIQLSGFVGKLFPVCVGEPPKSRTIRFTGPEYWTTRSVFFMSTANVNALLQNYDHLNRS